MQKPVYEDLNYQERFDARYEELSWLYMEFYRDEKQLLKLFEKMYRFSRTETEKNVLAELDMAYVSIVHEWAQKKPDYFITSDSEKIPQLFRRSGYPGNFLYYPEKRKYVMTDRGTDQWNLNYQNPRVFQEMVGIILAYIQKGTRILLLKNLPYIWKELGTDCYDRPQAHKLLQILRLVVEVVCPEAELWAFLDLEAEKAAAYLGTEERPECHRIVNVGGADVLWHTLATRDVRLLKRQTEMLAAHPFKDKIVHMLWDGEEIRWRLDYQALKEWGMDEAAHRGYLNDYFARLSGGKWSITSMCGLEKAVETGNEKWQDAALRQIVLLYAVLYSLPGVPLMQRNETEGLSKLSEIRAREKVLGEEAVCRTMETGENAILCVVREYEKEKMIGLFNFSEHDKIAWIDERDGLYQDLLSGEYIKPAGTFIPGYGCYWLKKIKDLS